LVDGGTEILATRRAQVEDVTKKLQARIAYVDVSVSMAGAEVRIDDVVVGTSPLPGPVAVNPGPRRFSASKAGSPAVAQVITAAGGDHISVALDFSSLWAAKKRPDFLGGSEIESRTSSATSGSRTPLLASLVVTGVCAVTAGVFGWLALRAKGDLDRDLDTFKVSSDQLDSDRSHLRTYALVTDVAAAATLVAAGFSVYFVFSRSSEPAPQTATPRPFVALAPTLGGMVVRGGW
jgi:hypothetical protein